MAEDKKEVSIEEQRNKVIRDLVDLATEFIKLRPALSIHSGGLTNFIIVNKMCELILEKFTNVEEIEEKTEATID
jgi:hypothetical protein